MQHFGVIKFVNLVATILFFISGISLLAAFTFNLSVVSELQQAANFDHWKIFILLAGIVALLTAIVFAIGSFKEFQMYNGSHNSVVAEVIYILGLGLELPRSSGVGSETPPSVLEEESGSSSMVSIFGFGQDDSDKWTFAGRKPLPRENPENTENEAGKPSKPEEDMGDWDSREDN